jgi:NO-binding membrane sensor protein with MHYT domain
MSRRSRRPLREEEIAMPVTHEPWLVALSLLVAIQGAYVGLFLAVKVRGAAGAERRFLLAGAALSLGVAIWSMHFVAMLAARMPYPVDYLVFPTLLSFLVCVLVVGAAVFAASAAPLTPTRLAASAAFMGVGIVSMHYLGMTALHASVAMSHDPWLVGLSVAIAIAASGLALWLANGASGRQPLLLLSATALGSAIAGMHYTAMAAVSIAPGGHHAPISAPALSVDLLAIVVAVVAFIVSGLFLLILVPDRQGSVQVTSVEDSLDAASRATAGGDGAAPPGRAEGARPPAAANGASRATSIPVLHEGATIQLPAERIVAVHANAHYTYVFDGKDKYFCQLPISDIEHRLASGRFARVHRSHIINVDRIVRLRRTGDNGLIELDADQVYKVPVSRGRLASLKLLVKADGRA